MKRIISIFFTTMTVCLFILSIYFIISAEKKLNAAKQINKETLKIINSNMIKVYEEGYSQGFNDLLYTIIK